HQSAESEGRRLLSGRVAAVPAEGRPGAAGVTSSRPGARPGRPDLVRASDFRGEPGRVVADRAAGAAPPGGTHRRGLRRIRPEAGTVPGRLRRRPVRTWSDGRGPRRS